MNLQDRVAAYNAAYPKYPEIFYSKGWIVGTWNIGACYRGTGYYGEFPRGYLARLMTLWGDKKSILHVFSGSLLPGPYTRVDINPAVKPDIVCNAEELSQHVGGPFDLIILDPPYQHEDAKKYGYKLPNKTKVMRECAKVASNDCHLCLLDERLVQYSKQDWTRIGEILLTRSTNHRVRATFIFKKT